MNTSSKITAFEAMRGLAALIVVNVHMSTAFYPHLHPRGGGLGATWPTSFFWNGRGAVILFFVLSGFVLTLRYFQTGDTTRIMNLAVRRWPRLLFLTTIASVVSALLVMLIGDGYWHPPAQASKAETIAAAGIDPTLLNGFLEGFLLTFIRGDSLFVTPLWTMFYEFYGSYLVFGIALLVGTMPASRTIRGTVILVAMLGAFLVSPYLFAFTVGAAASWLTAQDRFALSKWTRRAAIVLGLSLLTLNKTTPILGTLEVYAIGAALLFLGIAASETFQRAMGGRFSAWLGRISFPLYVIHYPIIGSLGWWAHQQAPNTPLVPTLITLGLSLAVADLLSRADLHWQKVVKTRLGFTPSGGLQVTRG